MVVKNEETELHVGLGYYRFTPADKVLSLVQVQDG